MPAKKSLAPWVVVGGKPGEQAHCERCGTGLALPMPLDLQVMTGAMLGFEKSHQHCAPRQEAPAPITTLDDWCTSRDTGTSSATIVRVLGGKFLYDSVGVPHDPSDFGRCSRLLAIMPEWRARLPEVAAAYPEWVPFVREWDRMEALYAEESPSGTCPKLYAFMKYVALEGDAMPGRTAKPVTISIDSAKRCLECGDLGAMPSGVCMGCAADAVSGKRMKSRTGRAVQQRFRASVPERSR